MVGRIMSEFSPKYCPHPSEFAFSRDMLMVVDCSTRKVAKSVEITLFICQVILLVFAFGCVSSSLLVFLLLRVRAV